MRCRLELLIHNVKGGNMDIAGILAELDAEIAKLEHARALLTIGAKRGRGWLKNVAHLERPAKKRNLSPEGRARIAEGQRRRWAAKKKAAGK
jgi:hypothetical protein